MNPVAQMNVPAPWGNVAMVSYGAESGRKVLLVHGRQDSLSTFRPMLVQLPTNYHYVAVDMPGNGQSDPFPTDLSIKDLEDYVAQDMIESGRQSNTEPTSKTPIPQLQQTPQLQELPPLQELPQLQELPPLEELPQLQDIPQLQELPQSQQILEEPVTKIPEQNVNEIKEENVAMDNPDNELANLFPEDMTLEEAETFINENLPEVEITGIISDVTMDVPEPIPTITIDLVDDDSVPEPNVPDCNSQVEHIPNIDTNTVSISTNDEPPTTITTEKYQKELLKEVPNEVTEINKTNLLSSFPKSINMDMKLTYPYSPGMSEEVLEDAINNISLDTPDNEILGMSSERLPIGTAAANGLPKEITPELNVVMTKIGQPDPLTFDMGKKVTQQFITNADSCDTRVNKTVDIKTSPPNVAKHGITNVFLIKNPVNNLNNAMSDVIAVSIPDNKLSAFKAFSSMKRPIIESPMLPPLSKIRKLDPIPQVVSAGNLSESKLPVNKPQIKKSTIPTSKSKKLPKSVMRGNCTESKKRDILNLIRSRPRIKRSDSLSTIIHSDKPDKIYDPILSAVALNKSENVKFDSTKLIKDLKKLENKILNASSPVVDVNKTEIKITDSPPAVTNINNNEIKNLITVPSAEIKKTNSPPTITIINNDEIKKIMRPPCVFIMDQFRSANCDTSNICKPTVPNLTNTETQISVTTPPTIPINNIENKPTHILKPIPEVFKDITPDSPPRLNKTEIINALVQDIDIKMPQLSETDAVNVKIKPDNTKIHNVNKAKIKKALVKDATPIKMESRLSHHKKPDVPSNLNKSDMTKPVLPDIGNRKLEIIKHGMSEPDSNTKKADNKKKQKKTKTKIKKAILIDPTASGVKITRFHFVRAMEEAVSYLGWKEFAFIGHSMGCEHGLFYNAIYPNRITAMVFLDAQPSFQRIQLKPWDEYQKKFYDSYYDNYQKSNFGFKTYTKEQVTASVSKARGVTKEQAEILLDRNLIPVGDNLYRLSWDYRLKSPAPQNCPNSYYLQLFDNIPPTLLIAATNSGLYDNDKTFLGAQEFVKGLNKNNNFNIVTVEGNHDVHVMRPEVVGPLVKDFLVGNVPSNVSSKL